MLTTFTVIQTPAQAAVNPELVSLAGVNAFEPTTFRAGNSINSRIAGLTIGKIYIAEVTETESVDGNKTYTNLRVTGAQEITTVKDRLDARVINQPVKFLTTAPVVTPVVIEPVDENKRKGAETVAG